MNNGNGTPMEHESFIKTEESKPKIYLPGDEKFSSYKNTLQEFCQKKRWPVPVYKTAKERGGVVGMVTFSMNHVKSENVSPNAKEAETRVAYDALRKLGYLDDHEFSPSSPRVKVLTESHTSNIPADEQHKSTLNETKVKCGIKDITFKMLLNQYAQKTKLPTPVYKTESVHNAAFTSVVEFNDQSYRCLAVYKRQKDAEQNAAQVALTAVLGFSPEELKRKGVSGGDFAESVGKKVKPEPVIGTPKSMLNEYAQKMKKHLPTYTAMATTGGFLATVLFDGREYKGMMPGLKIRDAEQNAAKIALATLTGAPIPKSGEPIDELDVNQMVTEQRQLTQPASLKNRLQEYCQRLSKPLPKYTTVYLEVDRFYQSVVEVQNVEYSGLPKSGKKNAEFAAAEVALKALELMA